MHIPSLLFSTLGVISIASAFPSRISHPKRLFPRLELQKLDANADEDSLRYQPALCFGNNTCYHTAAINKDGTINTGLSEGTPARECRDKSRLANANVYTRKRCNNGWCAYMYDYYFEVNKFVSGDGPHWQNVVVFVKDNTIQYVAVTAYGSTFRTDKPLLQDSHPLIVYKSLYSWSPGFFRFAKKKDVECVKKTLGKWVIADLVGWDGFPTPGLKKKLSSHDFGNTAFHLTDAQFVEGLQKAAGSYIPGFNFYSDETKDVQKEKQKEKVKGKDKLQFKDKDQKIENLEEKDSNKKFDIKEKEDKKEDKEEDKEEEEKDEKKKFDIKEKEEEKKVDIKENVKDKEDKEDKKDDEKEDEKEEKKQFDIKNQKDEDK